MSANTIKLVDVPEEFLAYATDLARRFHRDFPDRIGVRDGCAYRPDGAPDAYYVYRLKSMIVVRGQP